MQGEVLVTPERLPVWIESLRRARRERVHLWHTKRHGWRARAYGQKHTGGAIGKGEGPYTLFAAAEADGATLVFCTCPGYSWRQYCKHSVLLAVKFAKDGETVKLEHGWHLVPAEVA